LHSFIIAHLNSRQLVPVSFVPTNFNVSRDTFGFAMASKIVPMEATNFTARRAAISPTEISYVQMATSAFRSIKFATKIVTA
jgi:hypothetical protein